MTLRAEDSKELEALHMAPEKAIRLSWFKSNACFAVYFHERLACIWGIRRMGPNADVWLLTTEEVELRPIAFHGESLRLMAAILREFEAIHCEVHWEYTRAVNWLKRLGFCEITERNHFGFITMERRR